MAAVSKRGSAQMHWSTHTPACDHCRARKIKCNREQPACWNCAQEGTLCGYSDVGKRVNHVKLQAQSISGLQNRLVRVEETLERLTETSQAIYKKTSQLLEVAATSNPDFEAGDSSPSHAHTSMDWKGSGERPIDRHVVHYYADSQDMYHGPCTLLALCREFGSFVLDPQTTSLKDCSSTGSAQSSHDNTLDHHLKAMYSAAMDEEVSVLNGESHTITLPPKQLLMMACPIFFQQEDPALQVFCPTSFYANINRIYSRALTRADNAWALCSNVIILLVLGAQQSGFDHQSTTEIQFSQPFLNVVKYAIAQPEILMLPKLINVQALALLSIVVQLYLQPHVADVLFGQACLLAKRMGLGLMSADEGLPPEASEQRLKVFRGLYLRDKSLSISRGTNCLLPWFDYHISVPPQMSTTANHFLSSRLLLAKYQEKIYKELYSMQSLKQVSSQRQAKILFLDNALQDWARIYDADMNSPTREGMANILMDFYAARIAVLRLSCEPRHQENVISIARASCRLLLSTASKDQQSSLLKIDRVLTQAWPVDTSNYSQDGGAKEPESELPPRICSLVEKFPLTAFFALANNIIRLSLNDSLTLDLALLQIVHQTFREHYPDAQAKTLSRQSSQVMETVLDIIQALRPDLFSCSQLYTNPLQPSYTQYDYICSQEVYSLPSPSSLPAVLGKETAPDLSVLGVLEMPGYFNALEPAFKERMYNV